MEELDEARRLMELVADQAPQAGRVDALTVISMAKVWAHIALAEATTTQNAILERIARALEERNA